MGISLMQWRTTIGSFNGSSKSRRKARPPSSSSSTCVSFWSTMLQMVMTLTLCVNLSAGLRSSLFDGETDNHLSYGYIFQGDCFMQVPNQASYQHSSSGFGKCECLSWTCLCYPQRCPDTTRHGGQYGDPEPNLPLTCI